MTVTVDLAAIEMMLLFVILLVLASVKGQQPINLPTDGKNSIYNVCVFIKCFMYRGSAIFTFQGRDIV